MRRRLGALAARLPKRRIGIALLGVLVCGAIVAALLGSPVAAVALGSAAVCVGVAAGVWIWRRRRARVREAQRELAASLAPRTRIGALDRYGYAAILRRSPWVLLRLGARYRSSAAVDLLARRASRGQLDWSGLQRALLGKQLGPLPDGWWIKEILAGAYLAMMLEDSPERTDAARAATHLALDLGETDAFGAQPQLSWAFQAAVATRDRGLVERLAAFEAVYPEALWAARLDLVADPGSAGWRTRFDEITQRSEVEAWCFDPLEGQTLFAGLRAPEVAASVETGLGSVTVIVPTFNPSASYLRTIESLTRQSWRDLEIVIIDDASEHGREYISQAAASDPRVRVIRREANGGAYRARNAGLRAATGEFVTVVDADDLAHPRRIEAQLRPFRDRPEVIATLSRAVRLTADGKATLIGFTPERMNTSSLLFRRREVVDLIGYYDDVRKAGDTEYMDRMRAMMPERSIVELPAHLGLTQLTPGSLSRGDFKPGNWHSGDRVAYRKQFRGWHADAVAHERSLRVEIDGAPAFAAPARLRGTPAGGPLRLAVLRDWAPAVERFDDWAGALRHLAGAMSGPIGLVNGAHPRHSSHRHESVRHETWQLVEDGAAEWVAWAETRHVHTLVVTDPEYLLLLPDRTEIGLTVERLLVVVEHPVNLEGRRAAFVDRALITGAAHRAFDVSPEWVVGAGLSEAEVLTVGNEANRAVFVRADQHGAGVSTEASRSEMVTIGVVNAGLPDMPRLHERWLVEHLGGAGRRVLLEGAASPAAEVISRSTILVIDPFDRRAALRHDLVWQAFRAGSVVVAPQRYRDVYGAAILPGGTEEIRSTLQLLMESPGALARHREAIERTLDAHDARALLPVL